MTTKNDSTTKAPASAPLLTGGASSPRQFRSDWTPCSIEWFEDLRQFRAAQKADARTPLINALREAKAALIGNPGKTPHTERQLAKARFNAIRIINAALNS